ncbi:MAG TPA: GNAT family N-acetyltransferase, partial [Lacunisphaera sp.]|nr:GNAT family N-acetyltransferase [Lacunisphaera sp.]
MKTIRIVEGHAALPLTGEVVRLHRQELTSGFLSSLGGRALSLMFEFAAEDSSAILLVAQVEGGRVAGFLLGSVETSGFYRNFLRKKSLRAFLLVAPKLLFSPARVRKICETLLYPTRREVRALPAAELMDRVVDRQIQRQGVGRALFARFAEVMAEKSVGSFRITTGAFLADAHRFYEKMGAVRMSDIEVHAQQV